MSCWSCLFQWEGVNKEYFGLLIKLQINCNSMTGADLETNCFLFKTKGEHRGKKTIHEESAVVE